MQNRYILAANIKDITREIVALKKERSGLAAYKAMIHKIRKAYEIKGK